MERNEENGSPADLKPRGPSCRRGRGSYKLVIAIWALILFGCIGYLSYAEKKKTAEAQELIDRARELYDERKFEESTACLKRSAELGNQWAQAYYGERLKSGLGTEKNVAEAVEWFRKSAGQNCYEGFYQLGLCYANGEGVERNQAEAEKWYRKASESLLFWSRQGNMWAQVYYGEWLKNGFGTEKNVPEAVKWFRKSAEQNCPEAFFQLGLCYEEGEGVDRDVDEAGICYRKALEAGFGPSAQYAVDRVEWRKATGYDGPL